MQQGGSWGSSSLTRPDHEILSLHSVEFRVTHPSEKETPLSYPFFRGPQAEEEDEMSSLIISQKLNEHFKPGEAKDLGSQ